MTSSPFTRLTPAVWASLGALSGLLVLPTTASADPLSDVAERVQDILTGELATAVGIIAIAYAGYVMMFGDGSAKRSVVSVCIGIAIVVGAARLFDLLF